MLYGALRWLTLIFTTVGLGLAFWFAIAASDASLSARGFMVGWLTLSVACLLVLERFSKIGMELIGLFALLVGWRISALINADIVQYTLTAAFLCYLVGFFQTAFRALQGKDSPSDPRSPMGPMAWHMTFLRLYVGLDFVPHFTEKLFAGPGPHFEDVSAFQALGLGDMSNPLVWFGGLCEFGAAVGIGLGLLTRFAAIGTTIYLMVATVMGKHFQIGFIWATDGGGWEYPLLWMVVVLSFAYRGAGNFSLDGVIRYHFKVPAWIGFLMGNQQNDPRF